MFGATRRTLLVSSGSGLLSFIDKQALARPTNAPDIIVGAPNSLTGGFAEGGRNVVRGLTIAVNEINDGGGISSLNGTRLKLIPADTSSDDPTQASSVTRRLISNGAAILVGCQVSSMTLAAQVVAEEARVPLITTSYADALVERGYKYTFKVPANSTQLSQDGITYVRELYRKVKKRDIRRIANFYGSDSASQAEGHAIQKLANKSGMEIVASGSFPNHTFDPTTVAAPVMRTKPDALYLVATTPYTILVVRALRSLGSAIPIIGVGTGISVKSIPEALGKKSDGVMGILVWNWDIPLKGVKGFDSTFRKTYPNELFAPQGAGEGYAIGMLIKATLEETASRDPKKLRDTLSNINFPTILPGKTIKFNSAGLNVHSVPLLTGWSDLELRTLWPTEYQSAVPELP